jgi:hypothetical protein
VDSLRSEILSHADILSDAHDIGVAGDKLILTSLNREPFIAVLDVQTGALLRSFGRSGQGPQEFFYSVRIVPGTGLEHGGVIWVRDASGRVTSVSTDAHAMQRDTATMRTIRPGVVGVTRLARPDAAGFIAVGHGIRGRTPLTSHISWIEGLSLVWLDAGGVPRSFPRPLVTGDSRLSGRSLAEAYEFTVCMEHRGHRLAIAYRLAGRLDIVATSDGEQSRAAVPIPFLPATGLNPETGRTEFWQGNRDNRAAYIACSGSAQNVFALYSGKLVRTFPGRTAAYARFVHVFDWDGRLARVIMLDHSTLAMAVDPNGDAAYTIDHEGPAGRAVLRVTRLRASETRQ